MGTEYDCLRSQSGSGEDSHQFTVWKPAPGAHPALQSSGPWVSCVGRFPTPLVLFWRGRPGGVQFLVTLVFSS